MVVTKADEATSYLSVACKSCYARVTQAELNGPGYQRIEGELLTAILYNAAQKEYLKQEHIPIRFVGVKDPDTKTYSLEYSTNIPVRYLIPKLHKQFRHLKILQRAAVQPLKE